MKLEQAAKQASRGPLRFGTATDAECMGIDMPDGRALLLDCAEKHDAPTLALVAHWYNNGPKLLEALKHAYGRLNAIPHQYAQTDFKLIREAIAACEEVEGV